MFYLLFSIIHLNFYALIYIKLTFISKIILFTCRSGALFLFCLRLGKVRLGLVWNCVRMIWIRSWPFFALGLLFQLIKRKEIRKHLYCLRPKRKLCPAPAVSLLLVGQTNWKSFGLCGSQNMALNMRWRGISKYLSYWDFSHFESYIFFSQEYFYNSEELIIFYSVCIPCCFRNLRLGKFKYGLD